MDVEAFSDTECINYSNYDDGNDRIDGFDEYIELLDRYDIKSTLFTVGDFASKISDRLKCALQNGHELALHGFNHSVIHETDEEFFKDNMQKSKEELSTLFGTEICGFRAPFFAMDNKHLNILKELGFKYDSSYLSFLKARHNVGFDTTDFSVLREGMLADNGFYEFSLSLGRLFGFPYPVSGGGYIRLAYWNFIKPVIKNYIKNHDFYVFYIHPFELSRVKPPKIKGLRGYDRFYLNAGLKNYKKHIEELILMLKKEGYEFITFNKLSNIINTKEKQA